MLPSIFLYFSFFDFFLTPKNKKKNPPLLERGGFGAFSFRVFFFIFLFFFTFSPMIIYSQRHNTNHTHHTHSARRLRSAASDDLLMPFFLLLFFGFLNHEPTPTRTSTRSFSYFFWPKRQQKILEMLQDAAAVSLVADWMCLLFLSFRWTLPHHHFTSLDFNEFYWVLQVH